MRSFGLEQRVRVGLAGPTNLATLLRYAQRRGVRASAQGLARQAELVRQLFALSAPDALVRPLAPCARSARSCRISFRSAKQMGTHVLANNLTRVMNIIGIQPLTAAMRA